MFKSFYRGSQGSVSVYFIVILVPIFLFQAVFIDLIRVRLAERESEMALKAGLRSVMSAFEPSLQNYGLYGLLWEEDKRLETFHQVLGENISKEDASHFRYIDTRAKPDRSKVRPVYTLANQPVLKRQIVQEMKVKAPLEFVMELTDKFKKTGASTAFSAASDYYGQVDKLEKLHWKREDALDQCWASAQNLILISTAGVQSANDDLGKLQDLADRIGLRSLNEINASLKDAQTKLDQAKKQVKDIQDSISDTKTTLAEIDKAVQENAERINALQLEIDGLEKDLSTVKDEVDSLKEKKENLEQLLEDAAEYTALFASSKEKVKAGEDAVKEAYKKLEADLEEAVRLDEEWRTEAERLRSSKSGSTLPPELFQTEAVYTREYFSAYKTGAAKIPAAFHGMAERWGDVEWWHSAKWSQLQAEADQLQSQIDAFESERKAEENQREQRNAKAKGAEQAERRKVKSALAETKQALGSCGIGKDPYKELYTQLEGSDGLSKKYKTYTHTAMEADHRSSVPDDSDKASGLSMDIIKQLGSMLEGFRDELFVNEYLLDKLNYRTSGFNVSQQQALVSSGSRSQPETHPLKNQEVEYALYGFKSCASNLGAAYSEMFLVLFGIRTVEALLEPQTQALQAGTPLLAFLAAAAQGAAQALADTKTLSEGGSVSLLKKIQAVSVTYKDFLRIFLLLHPNQSSVLVRLQALLELNTGVDLTKTTTYIQGSSTTSVKLWFMPGIMRTLKKTTGAGCTIIEGRCQIRKTAVYAYD